MRSIVRWFVLVLALHTAVYAQTPECVREIYTSQIGVREATGRNDGVDVEKYLASVKLGPGYAWCAAFVNWTLKECGYKTANSGWSPDWFPITRIVSDPRAGDVFGIYFPDKKRIAHVGFIDDWGDTRVKTVEGNTNGAGSREGNGVYRKIRLNSQIYRVARWAN
jgi:hypothetical protein